MKAYIKGCGKALEVNVKRRNICESGVVFIWDDCGLVYETHISNVVFVGDANED